MFGEYLPLIGSILALIGVFYQTRKTFKQLEAQRQRETNVDITSATNSRYDQLQEDLEREQKRSETLLDRLNKMDTQMDAFRINVDKTSDENRQLKSQVDQVIEENRKLRLTVQISMAFIQKQKDQAVQAGIVPLELPELLRSI